MPQKYKTPFTKTLFDTTIDDILTPEDLAEYVALGANVHRYKFQDDDFSHIFDDRVDEHTKRMVLYAEHLPLSDHDKATLVRTLWIHDIPEILDSQTSQSDMTSIDKIRNPRLALAIKNREQVIIDRIFSLEDKQLYAAFDPAKEMLFKGEFDFTKTTPIGVLGRVIDNFIDGINSFHGFVTDYLKSEGYRENLSLPQRDSFHYCFQNGIDAYCHVSALDQVEYQKVRKVILDILEQDFFGFLDEIWTPLAVARLPDYAREEYERFRNKAPKVFNNK